MNKTEIFNRLLRSLTEHLTGAAEYSDELIFKEAFEDIYESLSVYDGEEYDDQHILIDHRVKESLKEILDVVKALKK